MTVEGHGEAGPTTSAATGAAGSPGSEAGPAVDDIALEILRVVVDVHTFEADQAGRRFRLVERGRSA